MKILQITILALILIPGQVFSQQKNVLFIAVDDLKPLIGAYGDEMAVTPNFDRLADMGVTFTNSHCQQAVCGPSRASLLTGLRPDVTEVWDLKTMIRDRNPDILTLPQHFKNNGYTTVGMGKIYDPRSVDKGYDKISWSVPYMMPDKQDPVFADAAMGSYQSPEYKERFDALIKEGKAKGLEKGKLNKYVRDNFKPSVESADVSDEAYFDGQVAKTALEQMGVLAKAGDPFFLAVGFKKPHLPFVAPQKYWELYDRDKMPLAEFQKHASNTIEIPYHNNGELRSYTDIEGATSVNDPLEVAKQKELIHGYYACVSYIDTQLGKVLDALESNGLKENTAIVLWGDHGWHLGDHGLWNKHTNFEQATRAPLIFVDPSGEKGETNSSPVEFVDIFPTLCDLAGIDLPAQLQGTSLKPILKGKNKSVKEFAISQFGRGKNEGYALRNDRYRLVVWYKDGDTSNDGNILFKELYDYKKDPLEKHNVIADYPELADQLLGELSTHLKESKAFKRQYKKSQPKKQVKTTPKSSGNNLIKNPGFEQGENGWNYFGNNHPSIASDHPQSGSNAMKIPTAHSGVLQRVKGLKPNTEYQLSAYIKSSNGETVVLNVKDHGGENVKQRFKGNDYELVSLTFKTGASNTSAMVRFMKFGKGSGEAWADDFTLTEVGAKVVATKPAANNLLKNPGLEDGEKGWNFFAENKPTIASDNPHSGQNCIKIPTSRSGAIQKVSGLKPDTEYIFSAYIQSTIGENVVLSVVDHGGEDAKVSFKEDTYEKVSVRFKTGPNNTEAKVRFMKFAKGDGPAWADDFELVEVIKGDGVGLKDIQKKHLNTENFYLGATIAEKQLGTFVEDILIRDFAYTVPENAVKQSRVHPQPDVWDWSGIDAIMKVAEQNDITVRLHGPISPQASKWAREDERTAAELEKIMEEYLIAECKRYNGHPNVKWMDVVNETVETNGSWFGPKPEVHIWENPWPQIGVDNDANQTPLYITRAFEIANQYAPDISLVYNQHGLMEPVMWERVKETILYLKKKGLRVDGLGWQAHIRSTDELPFDQKQLDYLGALIDWAHQNDLDFHVTEIDYKLMDDKGAAAQKRQADAYANILKVLLSRRNNGVVTYNTWGIVDGVGRHADKLQFLFTEEGTPKPAYYALKQTLQNPDEPPILPKSIAVLVENFDNGLAKGWIQFGKNKPVASKSQGMNNSSCVAFPEDKSGLKYKLNSLQPHTEYHVEVWVKAEDGMKTALKVTEYGGEDAVIRMKGNGAYQRGVLKFETGANSTSAEIVFNRWNSEMSGVAYLDDLSVSMINVK